MVKILHGLKDPRLWYLRYVPYFGSCRILAINRRRLPIQGLGLGFRLSALSRRSFEASFALFRELIVVDVHKRAV